MNLALGAAAALVFLGTDGFRAAAPETRVKPEIRYSVRFIESSGVGWRDAVQGEIQFVEQQGGATIWLCDSTTLAKLLQTCQSKPRTNLIQAPRVIAAEGAEATIANETNRFFVADVERIADGPRGQATRVSFKPVPRTLRDGVQVKLKGDLSARGVLTQVVVDDQRCLALHNTLIRDTILQGGDLKERVAIATNIQVPEVRSTIATGQWLLPENHVLVVSLGAVTVSKEKRKPELFERLVIIEAARFANETP